MNKTDQFLPLFKVNWYRLPDYLKDLESYVTFSDLNSADVILSGGVVWTGNELDFQSSEIIYTIDNVKYIAPPRDLITLKPTQPGLDRIDVFYIDTSGELKVRQGQESTDPSEPDIIEGEELKVSFVIIRDGQVIPDQVTNETVYNENLQVVGGEWNTSTPDSAVNLASTADAQSESTAIAFTIANFRDEVVFNNDVAIPGTSIDTLVFRVKLTRPPRRRTSRLFVQVNNTITSTSGPGVTINDGQYGFNASAFNTWQTIIVPASVLGVLGVNPDELIIRCYRRGMSFFVDNVLFQAGITTNVVIPEYTLDIVGDNLNLKKDNSIVSTVDLSGLGGGVSGYLEGIDEGNGLGYRIKDQDPNKFVNTGFGTIDLQINDDYVGTDFGGASQSGFIVGGGNRLPSGVSNYGSHVAIGAGNTVQGFYNNFALGTYNDIQNGYSAVALGYANTINCVPTVGQGLASGLRNNLSSYWTTALGTGLISKSVGTVVIGISNTDYAILSETAADRPIFIIGNGTASTSTTPSVYGNRLAASDAFMVRYDGSVEAPSITNTLIDSIGAKSLVSREWVLANTGGALTVLDEGNGNGIVIAGRTAANFGNVGISAIDLSASSGASSTRGATGEFAFATGEDNIASGSRSAAFGSGNTAAGQRSFVCGYQNSSTSGGQYAFVANRANSALGQNASAFGFSTVSSGENAFTIGGNSVASGVSSFCGGDRGSAAGAYAFTAGGQLNNAGGNNSFCAGADNDAYSYGEFSIGINSTVYTPNSTVTKDDNDRLFNIGNGIAFGSKSDAFTILKGGEVGIGINNFEANHNGKALQVNGTAELQKAIVDDITTAYELVIDDKFGIVTMNNAGANTLTIPANASVAFPIGTEIVIINKGAGVTTVAITTDTLNQNVGGLTLAQYDKRTLVKVTATEWIMGY
jgi:hypothetical protein